MALITKRRVAGLATTSAMIAAMAVAALPGATFAAAPRQVRHGGPRPRREDHGDVHGDPARERLPPVGQPLDARLHRHRPARRIVRRHRPQNGHDDSVTMVNCAETITGQFLDNDDDGTSDHVTYAVHRTQRQRLVEADQRTDGRHEPHQRRDPGRQRQRGPDPGLRRVQGHPAGVRRSSPITAWPISPTTASTCPRWAAARSRRRSASECRSCPRPPRRQSSDRCPLRGLLSLELRGPGPARAARATGA